MKIRTGFVSNSSSSSFILALVKKPSSFEEVHALMFPEGPTSIMAYDSCGTFTSTEIAQAIFADLQATEPLTEEQVIEAFNQGHISGDPDDSTIWRKRYVDRKEENEAWDEYYETRRSFRNATARNFMEQRPGKVFFHVTYSDNDGPFWTTMEHGDIFRSVDHFYINKH
jgi:hypothetical protein